MRLRLPISLETPHLPGRVAGCDPAPAGFERDRGRMDPALDCRHVLDPIRALPQSVHRRYGVRIGALCARRVPALHPRARRSRPPARVARTGCCTSRSSSTCLLLLALILEHSHQVRPAGVVLSQGAHPALCLHLHRAPGRCASRRGTFCSPARWRRAGWLLMVLYAARIVPDNPMITRDYVQYMTSNSILLGAEFDKVISMLIVTGILAVAITRARNLLVRSVVESHRRGRALTLRAERGGGAAQGIGDADRSGRGRRSRDDDLLQRPRRVHHLERGVCRRSS